VAPAEKMIPHIRSKLSFPLITKSPIISKNVKVDMITKNPVYSFLRVFLKEKDSFDDL
jgi:hypothetical protein